jgi:hypothetical protein
MPGRWAVPFDLSRLEVTGVPQPVVEEVNSNVSGGGDFDFSQAVSLFDLVAREYGPDRGVTGVPGVV